MIFHLSRLMLKVHPILLAIWPAPAPLRGYVIRALERGYFFKRNVTSQIERVETREE